MDFIYLNTSIVIVYFTLMHLVSCFVVVWSVRDILPPRRKRGLFDCSNACPVQPVCKTVL